MLSERSVTRDLDRQMRDISKFMETSSRKLDPVDRELMVDPGFRDMLEKSYGEARREGSSGIACGVMLWMSPWSLLLQDIEAPVHVWVGTRDSISPPSVSRRLASLLPNAELREFPGEGHMQLLLHWEEAARVAAGS